MSEATVDVADLRSSGSGGPDDGRTGRNVPLIADGVATARTSG